MSVRPVVLLLLAALPLAACQRAPAGCDCATATCLKFAEAAAHPVTLTGQLITLNTTDPGDHPYHPFALKLAKPLCVAADPAAQGAAEGHDAGPTTTVQLAPKPETPVDLIGNAGRGVAVTGKLFAAFSGWHATPVLIDADQLAPAR